MAFRRRSAFSRPCRERKGVRHLICPAGRVGWGLAVFFSIVPDIDLPSSRIGRPLFCLSVRLDRQHGHRTVTHSLVALLLVAGVASPLFAIDRGDWYWAILGRYWSHLWLDMLNVRDIDLFRPSPIRAGCFIRSPISSA